MAPMASTSPSSTTRMRARTMRMVARRIVETGVTSLLPTIITQQRSLYPTSPPMPLPRLRRTRAARRCSGGTLNARSCSMRSMAHTCRGTSSVRQRRKVPSFPFSAILRYAHRARLTLTTRGCLLTQVSRPSKRCTCWSCGYCGHVTVGIMQTRDSRALYFMRVDHPLCLLFS
ncbi:hypothetical protein JB92DRAFT_348488 [Gautieria morchelliformis]|nr:hypothetical protein JB92DRAFT_348488 [Gautieria morchelliformis]